MRYIITILILIFHLSVYSIDKIDSSRYIYAKNASDNLNLEELVNYLKKGAKGDFKTVETFFYWISLNIEYSMELKNEAGLTSDDVLANTVFETRKTICAGYSNLLAEMCKYAKIECVIIKGIAQDYIEDLVDSSNHTWNAVRIGKEWRLIDATWGSGGFEIGSTNYDKKMDLRYLYAEPEFLIIDHFPEDKNWQLLKRPITIRQFQSKIWDEKRFRKFNNLLDDEAYENHKQIMKNNGWE